jgi:hypothetical protein
VTRPDPALSTPLRRLFAVFWFLLVAASLVVFARGVTGMYDEHENDMRSARAATARAWVASLPLINGPDPAFEREARATRDSLNSVIDHPDGQSATNKDLFRSWTAAHPIPSTDWPHPASDFLAVLEFSITVALPFGIMTVIRWIITASWRLGPRW